MQIKRNFFNDLETPEFILAKANRERIGIIPCVEKSGSFNFNDLNEITFTCYLYTDGEKNEIYSLIDVMKYVMVPNYGFYYISSCQIQSEGTDYEYKSVTARSYEGLLGQKYLEDFMINTGETGSLELEYDDTGHTPIYLYLPKSQKEAVNQKDLMDYVLEKCPDWEVTYVDPTLQEEGRSHRSFDVDRQDVYSFLTTDVQDAFECFFEFDTLNLTDDGKCQIRIYAQENYKYDSKVYVSYDNLLQNANASCDIDNIKTCVVLSGDDDLTVREINMGYDRIYNFDYYNSLEYWSKNLYSQYNAWHNLVYNKGNIDSSKVYTDDIPASELEQMSYEDLYEYRLKKYLELKSEYYELENKIPDYALSADREIGSGAFPVFNDGIEVGSIKFDTDIGVRITRALPSKPYSGETNYLYILKTYTSGATEVDYASTNYAMYRWFDNTDTVTIYNNLVSAKETYDSTQTITVAQAQTLVEFSPYYYSVLVIGSTEVTFIDRDTFEEYLEDDLAEQKGIYEHFPSSAWFNVNDFQGYGYVELSETELMKVEQVLDVMNGWGKPGDVNELTTADLVYTASSGTTDPVADRLSALSQNGNVLLTNRPVIKGSVLISAGWTDTESDTSEMVHATTYNRGNVYRNFTPIIVDAYGKYTRCLSPSELSSYAYNVLGGATDTYKLAIGSTYSSYDAANSIAEEIEELCVEYYLSPEEDTVFRNDPYDYFGNYLPAYLTQKAIESEIENVETEMETLEEEIDKYSTYKEDIVNATDLKNNLDDNAWMEISAFIREDQISSTNYAVYDSMTEEERQEMLQSFLEYGQTELAKVCVPELTFSANIDNLFVIEDFDVVSDGFMPGKNIWISLRDDFHVRATLLSISINFLDPSDFTITFSNIRKKSKDIFTDLQDAINNATSVATSVSFSSSKWDSSYRATEEINETLNDGLLIAGQYLKDNPAKSTFVIDDRGIFVDTANGDYGKYDDEGTQRDNYDSVFIGGGRILITDDGWKHVRTSVGRGILPMYAVASNGKITRSNVSSFGLFADFVVAGYIEGSTIFGGKLYSTNSYNGYPISKFDLDNGVIHLRNANTGETAFNFDGTMLTVNGEINAKSGTIGGFTINENSLSYGSGSTGIVISPTSFSYGSNFKVTSSGVLTASSATLTSAKVTGTINATTLTCTNGTIAGFTITENMLAGGDYIDPVYGYIKIYSGKTDNNPYIYVGRGPERRTEITQGRVRTYNLYIGDNDENGIMPSGKGGIFIDCRCEVNSLEVFNNATLDNNLNVAQGLSIGYFSGNLRPQTDNSTVCGTENYAWKRVRSYEYVTKTSTSTSSDRKLKTDIADINENYEKLFFSLKPSIYRYKDGERTHIGAIAQDVEQAVKDAGLTSMDFAGYTIESKLDPENDDADIENLSDEEKNYYLRYEEFIMLNTHMLQKAYSKISELENKICELEQKVELSST